MSNAPKNVKVSVAANEILAALESEGYFESGITAYRTAIAVAIANELDCSQEIKTTENKWDTAAVFNDKSTNMEDLITLLFPEVEEPITFGMSLAEHGLRWIEDKRLRNENLWSTLSGLKES